MKSPILLISNNEVNYNLRNLISEANQKGFIFSPPVTYSESIKKINQNKPKIILINAEKNKLEALELCRNLKKEFKGSIKVFVFLSESSASEGSRFGILGAEVEDENSIKLFCDKLLTLSNEYIVDENIICFCSLTGGSGTSFTSIALSSELERFGSNSLLLENTTNFSIKNYLGLKTKLSLLGSTNQSKNNDIDWFQSFIYKSEIPNTSPYLNLFNNHQEKFEYIKNNLDFLNKLASDIDENDCKKNKTIAKSLLLIRKDLLGQSFSMFNEIIGLGSKLSQNFLIDLGTDLYSSTNMQFLRLAKTCLIFIKDLKCIDNEFKNLQKYLFSRYSLKIIPIIAAHDFNFRLLKKISEEEWLEILNSVPFIMPPINNSFDSLILKGQNIPDQKYREFLQKLIVELNIKLPNDSKSPNSILRFLNHTKGSINV